MLFTPQEIQAILALLNRTPMSPAEALYAQGFFQRLAAFCAPPKPEPEPEPEPIVELDADGITEALKVREHFVKALDAQDKENEGNE